MKRTVDQLLKDAVDRGDVPGVVAVATDAKGNTYEGGFGKRVLGQPAEMTRDAFEKAASPRRPVAEVDHDGWIPA